MRAQPTSPRACSVFAGDRRLASGSIDEVAAAAKAFADATPDLPLLCFDDATGELIELDLRGTPAQVEQRLAERFGRPATEDQDPDLADAPAAAPGRGRPKLGVVAREVTLLPRHWAWLATQSGSASVVLRRLVDDARKERAQRDGQRAAQQAAYRFVSVMAGDRANYEEALRALFAGDQARFDTLVSAWPQDVRRHAQALARGAFTTTAAAA